jgi:hypothetical protein
MANRIDGAAQHAAALRELVDFLRRMAIRAGFIVMAAGLAFTVSVIALGWFSR